MSDCPRKIANLIAAGVPGSVLRGGARPPERPRHGASVPPAVSEVEPTFSLPNFVPDPSEPECLEPEE